MQLAKFGFAVTGTEPRSYRSVDQKNLGDSQAVGRRRAGDANRPWHPFPQPSEFLSSELLVIQSTG